MAKTKEDAISRQIRDDAVLEIIHQLTGLDKMLLFKAYSSVELKMLSLECVQMAAEKKDI